MAKYPSIFNDVIGPVMRGPSSSHCAASLRIGRLCRDLMGGTLQKVHIEFDPQGSLATTHESQGSDMGLFGGFLGWEAHDERLSNYQQAIQQAGIAITIAIVDIDAEHPNTYKLTLSNAQETRTLTAISVGGGMIEVLEIDGTSVSITGDFYEALVYVKSPDGVMEALQDLLVYDEIHYHEGPKPFIEIKSQQFASESQYAQIASMANVLYIKQLSPVLPVLSHKSITIPFITCETMLAYNQEKGLALWELALEYESARGQLSSSEVYGKMRDIVKLLQSSINQGLQGTEYQDRLLGCQSGGFQKKMKDQQLVQGDVLNQIILFVTALMEVKSSMGVIVAAPTAGACGALPGAVLGLVSALGLPEVEATRAMLAAGLIGVFISAHATFAAEVGGCQAECGSGAGMAAAAIVGLMKGSLPQALAASSMALQNSLGMICDPIANRVEAPCLGKNVMAASNALSCANMALANYDPLIPLDEVIRAMDSVGHSLPSALRCTGYGGLSITPTAKKLESQLQQQIFKSC